MSLTIVILAAGKGTRMRSALPKVLQPLAAKPLLAHVVQTALSLQPTRLVVVYGHGGEQVRAAINERFPTAPIAWAEQAEQRGTGHAVLQAMPYAETNTRVLVLYGDVPLTTADTLRQFVGTVAAERLGVLTVRLGEPKGYGRIMRNASGDVEAIVEEKDATEAQRQIEEVNSGIMIGPAAAFGRWLPALKTSNAQGEYYLTDVVAMAAAEGRAAMPVCVDDPVEVEGVNDKLQLARLERLYQARVAAQLMRDGATLMDPSRLEVRGQLTHGMDCSIDVNCVFEGRVILGNGVSIGSHCVITDCEIGDGVHIKSHCVLEGARIAASCDIGPYARLRPGTELGEGARIGNFVETKNARLDANSKANHLTYLGDCEIGRDVNVGAGTITCNYDGANKHKTVIGDGAFIGSNASLVAPIEIGAGATIGAGSTVTKKAEADALTVTRAKQTTIVGWKRPVKQKH
jgi:bifunctional UDP-N-acetylglucosamine pyrophosphorylase/glucosamine-1-phosphate N-acetyltransferase